MPESQPTKEIPALRCATAGMNDWLAANSEVIIPCANWPVVSAYGPYSGVMWQARAGIENRSTNYHFWCNQNQPLPV